MSVEAPNTNHKFQPVSNTTSSQTDPSHFQSLFKTESAQHRTDYTPKSPKNNTTWLEYSDKHPNYIQQAKQDMSKKGPLLLKISHSNPTESDIQTLSQPLQTNKNVKHFIIRHSQLNHHHTQHIQQVLSRNDGIAWLVLDHNKIDDRGTKHLADGLETNQSVLHVVLGDNLIGDSGAQSLANATKKNKTIQTLFVQGNNIGDTGATHLIDAIKNGVSFTTLDIRDNPISDRVKINLKKVCEANDIRCYT
jgi:Ran GTPase-activating protein (RanGAP) involved in mRNA processing and transport